MRRLAWTASLLLCSASFGGTITTLAGKTADGAITLDGPGIVVTSPTSPPVRVLPADLLTATFGRSAKAISCGVKLASGEIIAAQSIDKIDAAGVHLTRAAGPVTVPLDAVAVLVFRSAPSNLLERIPTGQPGALLDTGDYFQGDFRSLDGSKVALDSALFGPQTLDVKTQTPLVVLKPTTRPTARFIVRFADGSTFLTDSLTASDGRFHLEDAILGNLSAQPDELSSITAAGTLLTPLSSRQPDDAPADSFVMDGLPSGLPLLVHGRTVSDGVGQRAGTSLTWKLGGVEQSFIAFAAVPASILPVGHARFVVVADGVEKFRSQPLSSINDPATVVVPVKGVESLTLRIEDEATTPAVGFWAEARLVHQ